MGGGVGPGDPDGPDSTFEAVNMNVTGDLAVAGTTTTGVLTITGGADIAEPFEFVQPDTIAPGQVVVIDEQSQGRLRVSAGAYDTRVAGVVAGAGDLGPGLTLSRTQPESAAFNVALAGIVYVLADTSNGEIKAGDLLTSSELPGHAMRVSDPAQAAGAVLGKALGSLADGQGLILMLVALQ